MKSLHLQTKWLSFSKAKIIDAISKCSSLSTPESDYISWNHLKVLVVNTKCITNFVNIANSCINLGYWLSYFKKSILIIIPKPNKPLYNIPKIFQPIVLLNMLGKLIEKAISEKLQIYSITSNFIDPNHLGDIKQCSTTDIGIYLTHLIHMG